MKISIIHPTRGRKQMAFDTVYKWLSNADNLENISYCFSVDTDDEWMPSCVQFAPNNCTPDNLFTANVIKNNNKSAIEAINFAAKLIHINTNSKENYLLVIVSDDFSCPEHWDTLLLDALKGKSDFIVKTQDGIQKTLITLPILDRTYYERFGYVYFGEYQHLWCDTEMTVVAHYLGKVINLPIEFKHNHHSIGATPKDAISIKNDSTWMQGELLFNKRLKDNFGIKNPLIRYEDIQWR